MGYKCKNPYLDNNIDGAFVYLLNSVLINKGIGLHQGFIGLWLDENKIGILETYLDFEMCTFKEKSVYEVFNKCIPDGMRYNKELDKLVSDVVEYKSNQEIETLFKEAMKQNKDNLSIISGISKELSSKYPFDHMTVFYIVRDNFLFKGKNNLKENSIQELDKLVSDVVEEQDFKNPLKDGTHPHIKFFASYFPSSDELLKAGILGKPIPISELAKKDVVNKYTAGIDLNNDLQDILESDMKYGDKIRAIRNTSNQAKEQITPHYYGETCLCGRKIDWYVIGDLYRKNKGSAWDHAGKKLLRAGEGHKTLKEDIKEVINSLTRWLEQIEDKEKTNVK